MTQHASGRTRPYETRLLLITIIVCVAVLLLLSRLRFPEPPPVVNTAVQPLERLAARASYDALAADIERLAPVIAPHLLVVRTTPRLDPAPKRLSDLLQRPEPDADAGHVVALRVDAGTALAALSGDVRIESIVGAAPGSGTAAVLGVDPVRRIARLRVPAGPDTGLRSLPLNALSTPAYVVAVEGTQAGPTLRPVFLGTGQRFSSPRFARPLMPLGGISVVPGALLFALSGDFVGVAIVEDGTAAIVGALDVLDAVTRLAAGSSSAPSTLGVALQPLTPDLAAALGTERGVVVSAVEADGPAEGILRAGDVITALAGEPAVSPERLLSWVAERPTGQEIRVQFVRAREPTEGLVTLRPSGSPQASPDEITFETVRGTGSRVARAAGGRGLRIDGLQPDDIVVSAGGVDAPTPSQLRVMLEAAEPGTPLAVAIERGGEGRIVAVRTQSP